MDEVRLIIFGVGVLIIAVIYFWGIGKSKRSKRRPSAKLSQSKEPILNSESGSDDVSVLSSDPHLAEEMLVDAEIGSVRRVGGEPPDDGLGETAPAERAEEDSEPLQKTLFLIVSSPAGQSFSGQSVMEAAEQVSLKLGGDQLLHYSKLSDEGRENAVFSVAHLREPGTFDPEALASLSTPGLLLYMNLPGPIGARQGVELMLLTAQRLAEKLDGKVCDQRRKELTEEGIIELREKAAAYNGN